MIKIYQSILVLTFIVCFSACKNDAGNERLETASEKVGASASKVFRGVKAGIEKVSKINVEVSENLTQLGVSTGKVVLSSKAGGKHNLLNVYVIFDKKINKTVTMRVLNNLNQEIGRCKTLLKANDGDATYIDFLFDKRTNIDHDSKIILQ